jgi:RND family efflux transporter MFP subunit
MPMETTPRRVRSDRSLRVSAAAAALLLAAGAGAQPVAVRAIAPEQRDLARASTQPGTAEAFYEADLGAKVSGYVSELAVDIGSRVKTGQVLARVAVPELVQSRNAAMAKVAALKSAYERTAMLAERDSVTQRALTEAKDRLDTAVAEQAEVEAQMQYATVEAPFDGVVTARTIDPGDMVFQASSPKGGGQPLLRVAKTDTIRVKTYVPERDAVWVDVGDPATVTFDALPGRSYATKIARVSGALDPATRTMLVELDLPNADGRIKPGLYGQTRIALERREHVWALPTAAVRTDAGNAFVYVVAANSTAHRVPVTLGLEDAGWIEIVSGLAGGERVVTGTVANLADGAAVQVAP